MKQDVKGYSLGEELANSISHGVGVLFSCAAIALLAYRSAMSGDAWQIVSSCVYGVTLFLLFLASTLYHAIPFPRAKVILKKCDHIAIYFLIAGSYTPFALITLREIDSSIGWWIFGIEWACALAGCFFKLICTVGKMRLLSTLFYVAMGWVAIFAIKPMIANLATPGTVLLLAGGATYTLGAIFYSIKSIPYFHAMWHLFVLAGAILHFLCIFIYVIGG